MTYIIWSNPQQHKVDIATSVHQTAQRKYKKGPPPKPKITWMVSIATVIKVLNPIGKHAV